MDGSQFAPVVERDQGRARSGHRVMEGKVSLSPVDRARPQSIEMGQTHAI